ncbi:MAG: tRNA preQ1(34) S-adenosylmethionine ribosyltransferase-isomerase QueA [Pseudomonadota bacterium]|jgi:S-adenosylmethionine:tRNA ribosyltransferase-isomerase
MAIGNMRKSDLQFEFPENLIAKEPKRPSRICSAIEEPVVELNWDSLLGLFRPGDLLVLNNTKVLKRRVFTDAGIEVLFLDTEDRLHWQVLFPSKKFKVGDSIPLPGGKVLTLLQKGRPQKVKVDEALPEIYFDQYGELPLPPYIQKVRNDRHTVGSDSHWYQTAWNEKPGSYAAPTASLHFTQEHLNLLRSRGVRVASLTLHVGLGTFLPVEVEDLKEHPMHSEEVEVPLKTLTEIENVKFAGGRVWAMGTTVTRALESFAAGKLKQTSEGFAGKTDLLILPGFQFKMVDCLLTNFHQPESTLLALVMAFAGIEKVKKAYHWAIKNNFRLFSYGDLSIWTRA